MRSAQPDLSTDERKSEWRVRGREMWVCVIAPRSPNAAGAPCGHTELWQKSLAGVMSHHTGACWQHKQEEAFWVPVQVLPLLTCFLPSLREAQHHVHGVPSREWPQGSRPSLRPHVFNHGVYRRRPAESGRRLSSLTFRWASRSSLTALLSPKLY